MYVVHVSIRDWGVHDLCDHLVSWPLATVLTQSAPKECNEATTGYKDTALCKNWWIIFKSGCQVLWHLCLCVNIQFVIGKGEGLRGVLTFVSRYDLSSHGLEGQRRDRRNASTWNNKSSLHCLKLPVTLATPRSRVWPVRGLTMYHFNPTRWPFELLTAKVAGHVPRSDLLITPDWTEPCTQLCPII